MFTDLNEVAEVMFLQMCVCPGGCLFRVVCSQEWLVPGPGEGLLRGVPGPGGVSGPGGRGSAPGGCLVLGGAWSWEGGIPACTEADPPGEMATAADGTHPTGMHSC